MTLSMRSSMLAGRFYSFTLRPFDVFCVWPPKNVKKAQIPLCFFVASFYFIIYY
jgi:hypothetical protein